VGLFSSNKKGQISEAVITSKLLEAGYTVLLPYGGGQRYDLVIEDSNGDFWRVQCKSGWINNDAILFDTANHNVTGKNRHWRNYRGQCHYFGVYCADNRGVYLVPVDQVGVLERT
jgi:hypothetical protein